MPSLRGSGRLVHAYLERHASTQPNKRWLSFLNGPDYTYKQLWDATVRVAGNLQRLGIKQGDRIAIMMGNVPELVITWFATHAVGAISVPLNTGVRGSSLSHMMGVARPRIAIIDRGLASRFVDTGVVDQSYLDMLVLTSGGVGGAIASEKVREWDETLNGDAPYVPIETLEPWDPSAIVYTSGTTGPSKGIIWTHTKTVFWGEITQRYMQYRPDDVVYICLPLFHCNALNMQLYGALLGGSQVVVAQRFSASQFWKEIVESKATSTNVVGAIAPILLRQPPSALERQHCLKRICCVPCPPKYYTTFPERFGVTPYEAYGLSDFGLPIWTPNDRKPRPGSCGLQAPEFECKLVNDLDEEVSVNEVGELVVRPLQPWIASPGYWEDPVATLKAWRNGWFHTGDLLKRDEQGWFYFVDRAKDAMKRRGENVSAFEVEQAFLKHESVLECAAYAIPSELSEDEIAIALVMRRGNAVRIEDLMKSAEADLPYFALPRYVRVVSELPKTGNEKVRKAALREEGVVTGMWDREAASYNVSRN